MQSKGVVDIMTESNADPKKDNLGSKSVNSLVLQQIAKKSDGLFLAPQQISIPMSIPIKFCLSEGSIFEEAKETF